MLNNLTTQNVRAEGERHLNQQILSYYFKQQCIVYAGNGNAEEVIFLRKMFQSSFALLCKMLPRKSFAPQSLLTALNFHCFEFLQLRKVEEK